MATTLIIFGVLLITSYVTASSIQTRHTCPSPRFCRVVPTDCPRVEEGYFYLGDQTCPGCPICVEGDPYLDENGCQWMACPMYGTLPGCDNPRFHFQMYDLEREEQCKACDAITCEDDEN